MKKDHEQAWMPPRGFLRSWGVDYYGMKVTEGWGIFYVGNDISGHYEVQRIDDPTSMNCPYDKPLLENDDQARALAIKAGLRFDNTENRYMLTA
jgi:hypothetical protein